MNENQEAFTSFETDEAQPTTCTKTTTDILLEQYKLYMEMLDRNTKRRMDTNTLFISINVFTVTITSFFHKGNLKAVGLICLAGILFSVVWYYLLVNYNLINKAKWDMLYDLEKRLPAQPFAGEWEGPKAVKHPGKPKKKNCLCKFVIFLVDTIRGLFFFIMDSGKEEQIYRSISDLERNLPRVFALLYAILFCVRLFSGDAYTTDLAFAVSEVNTCLSNVNKTLAAIAGMSIGS